MTIHPLIHTPILRRLLPLFLCMSISCAVGLLTGCSSGTVATLEPDGDSYATNIDYNNTLLATRLKVSDIRSRRVNDLLQIGVDFHNHWDSTLHFQYLIKFYDKDGFEIQPDGRGWTPITLTGNETSSVQAISPDPTAVTYKIYAQD